MLKKLHINLDRWFEELRIVGTRLLKKYLDRRRENSPVRELTVTEIYVPRVLECECLKKDTSLGRSPDAAAEGCPARKVPAKRKETGSDWVSRPLTGRERRRERNSAIDPPFSCKSARARNLAAGRCEGKDDARSSPQGNKTRKFPLRSLHDLHREKKRGFIECSFKYISC